jgi:hypothetical protein
MAVSTHEFRKATHHYLSSLLDELSIDERDSNRFNSSSLLTVDYQPRFLALL